MYLTNILTLKVGGQLALGNEAKRLHTVFRDVWVKRRDRIDWIGDHRCTRRGADNAGNSEKANVGTHMVSLLAQLEIGVPLTEYFPSI